MNGQKVDTVTYLDQKDREVKIHNVRTAWVDEEDGPFLVVCHSNQAPADMGWYDAQELNGYDEKRTWIPMHRILRIDGGG